MPVTVSEASDVTDELVAAFRRLIPQLSRSNPPPDDAALRAMVDAPGTHVLVARDEPPEGDGSIIGTLTLVVFRIPTAVRAWIEDVVVDEAVRGQGKRTGEVLCREAIAIAERSGAKTVDLTSRPSREHAHRLYERMGFHVRDTSVYRYETSPKLG